MLKTVQVGSETILIESKLDRKGYSIILYLVLL